jgi:hypothetical protein
MYQVSTVNLSPDVSRADVAYGSAGLGELSAEALAALLDRFRHIDAVENHEADPHLVLEGPGGKFHVRTGQGRLFIYNARATTLEPYAELAAHEIVEVLERREAAAASAAPEEPLSAPGAGVAPHRGIAIAILLAGVGLNAYTLYSVFYSETVTEKPAITLVADATEAGSRQQELAGRYATGDRAGDRVITIQRDGRVQFSEIGTSGGIGENADTYKLGKHGPRLCLATPNSGVIDVLNLETLVYYRDTYRRAR